MKESNYNFFVPYEKGSVLAYNAMTNALAVITKEDWKQVEAYRSGREAEQPMDETLLQQLKYGGFWLDENVDELGVLRYRQNRARYGTDSLHLTILPTYGCNFRCVYCFETAQADGRKMETRVQEEIVALVTSRQDAIRQLSVTWYGGEPMLAMDVIGELSARFLKICGAKGIAYHAGMITNGYFLTKENCKKLKDWKVTGLQITIDGTAQTHDDRRKLADGTGTFQRIMKNLRECRELLPAVSLRINTDRNNQKEMEALPALLEQEGLADVATPYLGWVNASNNTYEDSFCLTREEFARAEETFLDEQIGKGGKMRYENRYPGLVRNYCGADCISSVIIGPDGSLYRCWDDVGMREKSYGNLLAQERDLSVLLTYLDYDPTRDPQCRDCRLLPLCMGGCPRKRLDGAERCFVRKDNLMEYMKKVAGERAVKYVINARAVETGAQK